MPLPQIDPNTGERIQAAPPQIDPATGERIVARAPIPAPAAAPAGNTISQAPAPSEWARLKNTVANSAIGRSVESFSPKIASTLGITPTETVNSPTYQSDRQNLVAPQYVRPSHYTPSTRTRFDNVAEGALTGAGNLTSGKSLATGAAIAATGGLVAPLAGVGAALKLAGAGMGAAGVGSSLYGAGKAYGAGDTAGGDEQMGEAGTNAALMLPLAWEGATGIPKLARRGLAGDLDAPLPGGSGHTPATRYAAVQRVGVQPNAADATNSGILNAVRSGTEKTAAGAPVYNRLQGANMQALTDRGVGMQNDYSKVDPLTAGTGIQNSLQKPFLAADDAATKAGVTAQNTADDFVNSRSPLSGEPARLQQQSLLQAKQGQLQGTSQDHLQEVRNQFGDQPIASYDPMRSTARTIQQQNAPVEALAPHLAARQVGAMIGDIGKMGETAPMPTIGNAMDIRSRLLDVNANNPELVKSSAAADIERQVGATHQTILNSLPPEGQAQWLRGNEVWKDMKSTFDDPSSPYYSAIRGTAPNALTQGVGGTTPAAIETMQRNGMDMGIVQRGNAEKLLGTDKNNQYDLNSFGKRLYQMPEENRTALFGNEGNEALQKLAGDYAGIEPMRKAATAPIEDLRNQAFKAAPETLVNGVGPRTGSAFNRIAPMIGPEGVGAVQRGELTNLMGTDQNGSPNWKTYGRQLELAKQDPGYHGSLYGESPGGSARMNDLATAANMLTARDNPSGTAGAAQKLGDFKGYLTGATAAAERLATGHPLEAGIAAAGAPVYNASMYGTAKLMNSPKFVNWLMTPKPFQPFVPASAAVGTGAATLAAKKKK